VIEIAKTCPSCGEVHTLSVSFLGLSRFRSGTKVQDAFPSLTPTKREFMVTGICSDECWTTFVGKVGE
jgi:hypothetical protein